MQVLKKIPFFLLLLVLFFCLHGAVENYGFIGAGEVMILGLFILAGVGSVFVIIFFMSRRNYTFAALVTFFICLWYLFFGALHDGIKKIAFLSFPHSYSVLLPLLLLSTVAWIIFLKRKKNWHPKLVLYFNVVMLVYCCIDVYTLVHKDLTTKQPTFAKIDFDNSKVKAKPNVYYLLFDEYPGYQSLVDSFAYHNDSLYDYFKANGFNMLPTFSNYNYTTFSMSSIFNMQYVKADYDTAMITQYDLQQRIREIKNGQVFSWFRSMGYRVDNYSIFDIGNINGIADQNSLFPVHSRLLTDKCLHNRLLRDFGWWFATGKFQVPFIRERNLYHVDIDNHKAISMLEESLEQKNTSPRFCYAHLVLPHWPYFRDSAGNMRDIDVLRHIKEASDKGAFLGYVKYTGTVMRSLTASIIKHDPTAILVVMSDHGFRGHATVHKMAPYNFDNMCAVRFPDKNYIPLSGKWSTVNFFRYLFNCEYGQQVPYLKDSSIWINY